MIVLATIVGLVISLWFFRKNLLQIRQRNQTEESQVKKILNYPLTVLWYCYLIVFFVGLSVNNLL